MNGPPRQHLIFDADDTLWENNVVFEQVIAEFIDWLDHPRLEPGEVRGILDEVERLHAAEHGYGTKVFMLTLEVTVRRLREGDLTASDRTTIARLMTRLAWDQLDIIAGVPETLTELRGRHDLLLLTKGDHAEQTHKIRRSGLAHLFRRTIVTPEKTVDTYRRLVAEESLDPTRTWMIGELAPLRHPAGGRGGPARRLHPPRAHLAPRARRAPRAARPDPAPAVLPRPARALLRPDQ